MTDSFLIHGFLGAAFDNTEGALSVKHWTVTPADGQGAPMPLQSGDLVKIFKTVSAGDEIWCDKIELRGGQQLVAGSVVAHGMQAHVDPEQWVSMFFRSLPARLERDGRVLYGALEPFAETGTEGVLWAVHEYGVSGYDGLQILKDGDALTVYGAVRDGAVAWEGALEFVPSVPGTHDMIALPDVPRQIGRDAWCGMAFNAQPVIVQRPGLQP